MIRLSRYGAGCGTVLHRYSGVSGINTSVSFATIIYKICTSLLYFCLVVYIRDSCRNHWIVLIFYKIQKVTDLWFCLPSSKAELYRETYAISGGWRGPPRHPLRVSGGGDATLWNPHVSKISNAEGGSAQFFRHPLEITLPPPGRNPENPPAYAAIYP